MFAKYRIVHGSFNGALNIYGSHCFTQLPVHDKATVIIQYGREVIPTPAQDLEVCEVGLPQLMYKVSFVVELVGCRVRWSNFSGHETCVN